MTAATLRAPETPWTYDQLLAHVLHNGETRRDRTGTGSRSVFAPAPLSYDLTDNKLALITSKKVAWRMALAEFYWMLSGSTKIADLAAVNPAMADIWKAWAFEDGTIGPTYGAQYRNAGGSLDNGIKENWQDVFGIQGRSYGVDQLKQVVERLTETPDTRRAIISLWSAPELRAMALEPCMALFQFSLRGPNYDQLELHVYQRSADLMLGVPFDLFQASFLTHALARELTRTSGRRITASKLTWSAGDVHIYANQFDAAQAQLEQAYHAEEIQARIVIDSYPSLSILDGSLEPGHVKVVDYNPEPPINAGKPAV